MSEHEILTYSTYQVRARRESRLIPGVKVNVDIGIRCPRCDKIGDNIEHLETRTCACGLIMERRGNALYISEEE